MTFLQRIDAIPRGTESPTIEEGYTLSQRELVATVRAAHLPQIPTAELSDHVEILAECEERWEQAIADVTVAADEAIRSLPTIDRHLLTNADKRTVEMISLNEIAPIPNVYGLPTEWTNGSFAHLGKLVNDQHLPPDVDSRLSNMLDMVADVWLDDDRRPLAHASLRYFPPILVPVREYFAATNSQDLDIANRYAANGINWIALDGNARLTTFAAAGEMTVPAITAVDRTMAAATAREHENNFLQSHQLGIRTQANGVDLSGSERRQRQLSDSVTEAIENASSWSADGWVPMAGLTLNDDLLVWASENCPWETIRTIIAWEESDPGFLTNEVWSALRRREVAERESSPLPLIITGRIQAAQTSRDLRAR